MWFSGSKEPWEPLLPLLFTVHEEAFSFSLRDIDTGAFNRVFINLPCVEARGEAAFLLGRFNYTRVPSPHISPSDTPPSCHRSRCFSLSRFSPSPDLLPRHSASLLFAIHAHADDMYRAFVTNNRCTQRGSCTQ